MGGACQGDDSLAGIDQAQAGIIGIGDQFIEENFQAEAIFYQHIGMAQSHQLVGGCLKVVGANIGGHQGHHIGTIAGHCPGEDRDRQEGGHHLKAPARGAAGQPMDRAAARQQQGGWQEGSCQASFQPSLQPSLQTSCLGDKRRRPRSSQQKHATAANGNHYHC